MEKKLGKIIRQIDTKTIMDEQELFREYVHTDKITVGVSTLRAGAVGGLDKGHAEAEEVFYCAAGHVLCYFPEDNIFYELKSGDALLIPPATGHKLFNIGDETATIICSCAPHP